MVAHVFCRKMVGAIGFEPTTPCAQGRCATRLRYAPTSLVLSHYKRRGMMPPADAAWALDLTAVLSRNLSRANVYSCSAFHAA
jgi:hypothetical protein